MSDPRTDWPARLEIDPSAFVAPGAVVVGAVKLGARASVWFNTVVRGDIDRIEIGADTNLQDLTTVHVDWGCPTIVGERVTVGHRAIVHGCVIESDVLVGMGAVILSGARIGSGSLVGASALVREGQAIPAGSLVLGAPARVVGPVQQAHRDAIREGALHYAALGESYRARGFQRPLPWADDVRGLTAFAREPMNWDAWGRLLARFAEGPEFVAELRRRHAEGWARRPGPAQWAAVMVLAHLRDVDHAVLLPRVRQQLLEEFPVFTAVPVSRWPDERDDATLAPDRVLGEWRAVRAELLRALAPLGPREWNRVGVHPRRGAETLADMLRAFVEHELSHRQQMARALGEFA